MRLAPKLGNRAALGIDGIEVEALAQHFDFILKEAAVGAPFAAVAGEIAREPAETELSRNCSDPRDHMPRFLFPHATLSTCHACLISENNWDQREPGTNHVLDIRSRVPRCLAKEAMMRVLMLPVAAAILLIGADLLCAPAVNAQVQSHSPGATDQPSNIPDQKLDAAAAAIQRVTSLKQDYQQRIAAAAPADKERILNEAIGALEKAVTNQGLSVEEFDSIMTVAQNDPNVLEKIRQRLRGSAQ